MRHSMMERPEDKAAARAEEQWVTCSPPNAQALQGPRLWIVIGGMMLGVYVVGLDMTMLSTIVPTLTDYFGTVSHVGWYESAYVLAVCVFIPLVGRLYTVIANKYVYLSFMAIFMVGSVVCATSTSSITFIIGRAINGVGSAGLLSGALLIIHSTCSPDARTLLTSIAMSLISVGSITGPLIAGALTAGAGWWWSFWLFLVLGGVTMAATVPIAIPDLANLPPLRSSLANLHRSLDPVGFIIFAMATSAFLLAISLGGAEFPWNSPTVLGLLAGSLILSLAFGSWIFYVGDRALIPPASLRQRSVAIGSVVMFLQGGSTQMIPYFLPIWFQVIRGDSPVESATHMLPSLITNVIVIVIFGVLVRKLHYIPPWSMVGSLLCCIGSVLYTTFSMSTTTAQWVSYQVITSIGRAMAFQVPVVSVQEEVPADDAATALAVVNLMMNLGAAVAVSAGQTIFRNRLPASLSEFAPSVDASSVINAGATDIRTSVPPALLDGLLVAYNKALTVIFYYPAACSALALIASFWLGWNRIGGEKEKEKEGYKKVKGLENPPAGSHPT